MPHDKEDVRLALGRANMSMQYKQIAHESGLPLGALKMFASSGSMSYERREKLADYLAKKGFLTESSAISGVGNRYAVIAGKLRATAALIESPEFTDKVKAIALGDLATLILALKGSAGFTE
jgi:hypothetical protein